MLYLGLVPRFHYVVRSAIPTHATEPTLLASLTISAPTLEAVRSILHCFQRTSVAQRAMRIPKSACRCGSGDVAVMSMP